MSANMGERIEAVARALYGDWELQDPQSRYAEVAQAKRREFLLEARKLVITHDVLVAMDKGARL